MQRRRVWPFICFLILGACGDDPIAPPVVVPDGPLVLTLTVDPDTVPPGGESVVRINASLPSDQRLSFFQLRVSEAGTNPDLFDLPILGNGTHVYLISIELERVPFEFALHFQVTARVGTVGDSARGVLTVADVDGPPTVGVSAPRYVEPPGSLRFAYHGHDYSGLESLSVSVFDPRGVISDSIMVRSGGASIDGGRSVLVPPGTRLGDSVSVQATGWDFFGKTATMSKVVHMADTTPPTLTAEVTPGDGLAPGDTIRVHIKGADQYSLRALGYRWLHLIDSVTPAQRVDSTEFTIVVPPGTSEEYAEVVVWATDSSGNISAQNFYRSVRDGLTRPIQSLVLTKPFFAPGVLDTQRGRYYYAAFDNYVHAFALDPLEELAPILLGPLIGVQVRSVDLSLDGDRLTALLMDNQPARLPRLLSWDIDAGPSTVDTFRVTATCCGAWDMQVAANGHALVTGAEVVDVHLSTGMQRIRNPASAHAQNLVSSLDRRYVVQWGDFHAAVYQSDRDSLSPLKQLLDTPPPGMPNTLGWPYVSTNGSILIRNRLYDADLNVVRQLLPDPGQFPKAQALSPDGRWAYIGNWPGYWKVDVASGVVVEKVNLPLLPGFLVAHPDGERLIAFAGAWVGVVDLR